MTRMLETPSWIAIIIAVPVVIVTAWPTSWS